MRGALLNYLEGIPSVGPAGVPIYMTLQEMFFWNWRVRGIFVEASGFIAGRSQDADGSNLHSDSYTNGIARTYYCQKPGNLFMSEEDQILGRRQYSNTLGGQIVENITEPFGDVTITAFQFTCDWGANAFHVDPFPETQQWVMGFSTGIVFAIPNPEVPVGATFGPVPPIDDAGFPGTIIIRGTDPVVGASYVHSMQGYWSATRFDGPGTIGVTSASASILIEADVFYDWSGLYDPSDGSIV